MWPLLLLACITVRQAAVAPARVPGGACDGAAPLRLEGADPEAWSEPEDADAVWLDGELPVVHYAVPGETWTDVSRYLACLRAPAYTNTRLGYSAATRGSGEACRVTRLDVTIDGFVSMPSWPGVTAATPDEQQAWDAFYARTREHEIGHWRIAERHGARLEEALRDAGCDELDATYRRVHEAMRAEQRAYDACTDFGMRQEACDVGQFGV